MRSFSKYYESDQTKDHLILKLNAYSRIKQRSSLCIWRNFPQTFLKGELDIYGILSPHLPYYSQYIYLPIYSIVQKTLWNARSYSACQRIAYFLYGIGRFITAFSKARHWTLSWASQIQIAPSIPNFLRSILILSSYLRLRRGPYLQASQPKSRKHLSSPPYVPHVPPTSSSFIWSPQQYSVKNTGCEVHHYAIFSTIRLPPF